MTPRARRRLLAAALACALAAAAPLRAAEQSVTDTLHLATRYSRLLRDSIAVVAREADVATIWAALDDARRTVAEIDRLAANAAILPATPRDRQRFQNLSAAAHLHLALFETRAMEFESAREEIARARAISDEVDSPEFRTPWVALQSGAPGQALVTRYNLLSLPEFEAALGSSWDEVRPVPFEFLGLKPEDLPLVNLVRSDRPAEHSLDARLLARGAALMRLHLERGETSFTVPLPPGRYRLKGRPGSDVDRSFIVPEVSVVDPVVVDRARFELQVEPKPGPAGPRFFLNGIEVTNLASMPYGVYRVKVDEDTFPNAPRMVRFILGEGFPDKTPTSWKIYVPAVGSTLFHLDKAPIGQRLNR
jgi:hypothetical protein